jgi:hypothetical protein
MKNKNLFTLNQTLKTPQKRILNKYVNYQKIRFSKIINPVKGDFLSIRPRCISIIKT